MLGSHLLIYVDETVGNLKISSKKSRLLHSSRVGALSILWSNTQSVFLVTKENSLLKEENRGQQFQCPNLRQIAVYTFDFFMKIFVF